MKDLLVNLARSGIIFIMDEVIKHFFFLQFSVTFFLTYIYLMKCPIL